MANFIFEDWFKKVDDLRAAIGKDLAEIRKAKEDVRAMRTEIFEQLSKGKIIRDNNRIVLSAPEIIIGNVNSSGVLLEEDGKSSVTIRTHDASIQAVSQTEGSVIGSITMQAPSISQEAIDKGIDGLESVVGKISTIKSIARNVTINSSTGQGLFYSPRNFEMESGVQILSDSKILIDATTSIETAKKLQNSILEEVTKTATDYEKKAAEFKMKADDICKKLKKSFENEGEINGRLENDTRVNVSRLIDLNEEFSNMAKDFYVTMNDYISATSALVESKRQEKVLKKQIDDIDKKAKDFTKKTTGTSIIMRSEKFKLNSIDGDGNVRDNPGAGLQYKGKNFAVLSLKKDGSLINESETSISSQIVYVNTADPKLKDPEKIDNCERPAVGKVRVTSKDIYLEAVDYSIKDKKIEEKALTKDGLISLRAENIDLSSLDKEGKATGKLGLNAKNVDIRATDVKKEKDKPDTDDKLAAGGQLTVSAENVFMGTKSKDNKSKKIQVSADNVILAADTTIEMQQGENNALSLNNGNASLGGAQVEICGDTTIKGGADIKGKIKATVFTAESVEASKSLKGPDTSDSKGAASAGKTEQISTQLKTEDVKNQ